MQILKVTPYQLQNRRRKPLIKSTRLKQVQGLASQTIVSILHKVEEETTTGELLQLTIHFKKALLKYLRFMLAKKLLKYRKQGKYTIYKTTAKGHTLAQLLCYKDKPLGKQRI